MNPKDLNTDFSGFGTSYFYHPGPAQVWLSRAPNDDLRTYQGDGDWFKIAYAGPADNQNWELYRSTDEEFVRQTDVRTLLSSF